MAHPLLTFGLGFVAGGTTVGLLARQTVKRAKALEQSATNALKNIENAIETKFKKVTNG